MTKLSLFLALVVVLPASLLRGEPIDRRALVARHAIRVEATDPKAPLSVGNGEFAYSFDVTGMQTFPSDEDGAPPLATMAQWAWHTFPDSRSARYEETLTKYAADGRMVSYATDMRSETAVALRSNPHRMNLARIGLSIADGAGGLAKIEDLQQINQVLDLWTGVAVSRFSVRGEKMVVHTVAHPTEDTVAFSVTSNLLADGEVAIEISFPYPAGVWGPAVDRSNQKKEEHTVKLVGLSGGATRFIHTLDETSYTVTLATNGQVEPTESKHRFELKSTGTNVLHAAFRFASGKNAIGLAPNFDEVRRESAAHWERFWTTGGVVDLSGSSDPRWRELERRIVLSQYLTAIHCAGSMPPQETGHLCNSWYGKSHLEMHWWHAAHFPLWGRAELLKRSLPWYEAIRPAARQIAQRQGYAGVRWPKMVGPHGVSSPSSVGELLIWQQPHPIYLSELIYRDQPTQETLKRFSRIVSDTAKFMADYAVHQPQLDRYSLGPVLIPAQECYEVTGEAGVWNPTFELVYWRWALRTANTWRERLGLPREMQWDEVAEKLARPNLREGVYTAIENRPFTRRRDHPSMLAAFGVMPDVGLIDPPAMSRTYDDVRREWDWSTTWGWDYPMMAMTAARLGRPGDAVDALLMDSPKNQCLMNGHFWQADRLPAYLPANGGLLTAVGMMAAGWDSDHELGPAPGFPADGSWKVRYEGLRSMP